MRPAIAKSLFNTALGHMIHNTKPYIRNLAQASAFITWLAVYPPMTQLRIKLKLITIHREDSAKPENLIMTKKQDQTSRNKGSSVNAVDATSWPAHK